MNDDFEITSNISLSSIYRKSFEDFLKNSIRLIINSRKKELNQNINRTLTFETDLNDNQMHYSSFEDLSFDSLSTNINSKSVSKQHIIDFFCIKNNENKLLIERWIFSFNENNNFINEFYLNKKLISLFRSFYIMTRILPSNKLKNMNNIIIDFQSYQNFPKTNFIFEPKELIHISNKKINNLNITVEYLTIEQIKNYFNKIEKKINEEKPNILYSFSFNKTNSFEILNYQEDNPKTLNEDSFSKKNIRKLSYDDEEIKKDYNIKNKEKKKVINLSFNLDNDLELIELEDNVNLNLNITEENETLSSIYKNLKAKNITEENSSETKSSENNIKNKRFSRYKTADTNDSNSSIYNLENEKDINNINLNSISGKNNNENLIVNKKNIINEERSIKIYNNVRKKYFELKEKIVISKNDGININKLFFLINNNH